LESTTARPVRYGLGAINRVGFVFVLGLGIGLVGPI
jgi:hypothetical protein